MMSSITLHRNTLQRGVSNTARNQFVLRFYFYKYLNEENIAEKRKRVKRKCNSEFSVCWDFDIVNPRYTNTKSI